MWKILFKNKSNRRGFTLVELLVSISIFTIAMVAIMSSVLTVLSVNNKAQSKKTAMDNLDVALESISRTIRFGSTYHCGATPPLNQTADCASGAQSITLQAADGTSVTYSLAGGAITRSINGANPLSMTSSEVNITALMFRVFGSASYASGNYFQPQVIITVTGIAGSATKASSQSTFQIETTVSQRKLDI